MSGVPPADEIISRVLAVAETAPPGTEQEIDAAFAAVDLPDAPTLRALLLRSRMLHFPRSEETLWGLSHEAGDGFDLVGMAESFEPLVPLVGDCYGWSRTDKVWCRWDFFTDTVIEEYPDDASALHVAFTHLAPGYAG